MNCPSPADLDLLAMDAFPDARAAALREHLLACPDCRGVYAAARRADLARVRMYEAFDRDHDELREQLLAALPPEPLRRSRTDPLVRGWHRLGDAFMSLNRTTGRRTVALLAPAAAILLAVIFFVTPGQKSAFAAALEHLRQARSFICRVTIPEGIEAQGLRLLPEGTLQFSDEYGSHSEMRANGVVITEHYAPVQGPMILTQPVTKTWMQMDVSQVATLNLSEQSPDAFVRALRKLTDDGATELGQQTIDGRPALGYRVAGEKLGFPGPRRPAVDPAFAEVWVDAESRLPARLVIDMPLWEQDQRLKIVYDRFEWNVPLAAGVFEPAIPPDYVQVDAQLARPCEAALLNALKQIAYWTGRYPEMIGPGAVLGRLHTMIAPERQAEFEDLGREGIMRLGIEIGGGTMYYMQLVRDGREPEYFGDEVTPADAGKVLLRWQLDDGQIRVIYGDLRVETVTGTP